MEWTVTSPTPYVWSDGSSGQYCSGSGDLWNKGHVSFQWVPMTYIAEMIEF